MRILTILLAIITAHATSAKITDGMADSLIYEASEAVSSLSNDSLTTSRLQAAAPLSPAIARYAGIRAANRLDTANAAKTAAAEALADIARRCSPRTRARTLYNLACTYYSIYDKRCLSTIEKAVNEAAKDRSSGAERRLVLYELTLLHTLRYITEGENPMRFAELFSLEKRALQCYESQPDSRDKAEAYMMLAQMKAYTDFPDDFALAQDSILLADPATDPAQYTTITSIGLRTNSDWLYAQSAAIYRRMPRNGHPDFATPMMNYLMSRTGKDDGQQLVTSADSIVALTESALPTGHPCIADTKALRDYIAAVNGQPMKFTQEYADLAAACRAFYGEETPGYLSSLFMMTVNMAFADGGNALPQAFNGMEKEYSELAIKVFADDPGQYVANSLDLIYAYETYDKDTFLAKLAHLTDIALQSGTRPSWRLVAACNSMSQLQYNYSGSHNAIKLLNRSLRFIDQLADESKPAVRAVTQYSLASCMEVSGKSSEEIARQYEKAIQAYAGTKLNPTMLMLEYSKHLNAMQKYGEAKKLLGSLLEIVGKSEIPADKAYVTLWLGQVTLNSGSYSEDSLRSLFEQGAAVFMADNIEANSETLNGYIYLSSYYKHINRDDLALKAVEKGWNTAKEICQLADFSRYNLFDELFSTYMFLNRQTDAELLNEQEITAFESAGLQVSLQYLEMLWNRYLIFNWRTPDDEDKTLTTILPAINVLLQVYEASGGSIDVIYKHGIRILATAVDFVSKVKKSIDDKMADTGMTYETAGEHQKYIDKENESVDIIEKRIIPILLELEKGFPLYSKPYDYRMNPQYLQLIKALMQWYSFVHGDTERELHYMERIAEAYDALGTPWKSDRIMTDFYANRDDYKNTYKYNTRCYKQIGRFSSLEQMHIGFIQATSTSILSLDDEAVEAALAQARRLKEYILGNFDYMASNEREQFLSTYRNSSTFINAMMGRRSETLSGPAYDAALFDKGLLLHSWERLKRSIMRSGDSSIIAKLDTLDMLKKQKSAMETNFMDSLQNMRHAKMQTAIDRLEKELAWRTAKFRSDTMRVATWQEVQARLGDGEAAIEFIQTDSVLAALVLRKGYETPRYVRLGNTMECFNILNSVADMPAQTKARRLYTYGRSKLYDMLWKPMEECLQGVKTVYYSPTAFLHRVAFAAIPVSRDTRLIDRYDLRYLSTTAQLLRGRQPMKAQSAAVFGGMYYSPEHAFLAEGGQKAEYRAAMEETFPYLEETRAEADTISRDMKNEGLQIKRYVAENATEPNFYALDGQSTDIIHLATHGFYIDEKDVAANAFLANHPGDRYSSMQRTGLTFDGANATWLGQKKPDREDGILTAAELSTLDLGRAQLVTLSACETALGDYSTEGVYGLQRGFKEAGARTLILSLWNVSDKATSLFMQDFYSRWLAGMSKHDAFTQAVAQLRATHPDPFFWAAFVMLDPE